MFNYFIPIHSNVYCKRVFREVIVNHEHTLKVGQRSYLYQVDLTVIRIMQRVDYYVVTKVGVKVAKL